MRIKEEHATGYALRIRASAEELYAMSIDLEIAAMEGTRQGHLLTEGGVARYLIEREDEPDVRTRHAGVGVRGDGLPGMVPEEALSEARAEQARMKGRRVYLFGHRIHHGAVGVGLAVAGALLAYHDRRDWPWPLIDRS